MLFEHVCIEQVRVLPICSSNIGSNVKCFVMQNQNLPLTFVRSVWPLTFSSFNLHKYFHKSGITVQIVGTVSRKMIS